MIAAPGGPAMLALLCALLFADGATFAFATTPLVLEFGKRLPAWEIGLVGGAASALGSTVQFLALRWALAGRRRWMQRLAPSRKRVEEALARNPSSSFLAIVIARATPLPDTPVKLAAAAGGYPAPRFGLATWIGAVPYYFALALLGRALKLPLWLILGVVAALLAGFLLDRLRRARRKRRRISESG